MSSLPEQFPQLPLPAESFFEFTISNEGIPLHIPERPKKNDFAIVVGNILEGQENHRMTVVNTLQEHGYIVIGGVNHGQPYDEYTELNHIPTSHGKMLALPPNWMRDAFWDTGSTLYVRKWWDELPEAFLSDIYAPSGSRDVLAKLFQQLNVSISENRMVESPLGIQGFVVADDGIVFVHSSLINHRDVQDLADEGFHIFGIPVPTERDVTEGILSRIPKAHQLYERMKDNSHIDMAIAFFTNDKGERLLLVTSDYMEVYGDYIHKLRKVLQCDLCIHSGRHANIPILPDGVVLLEQDLYKPLSPLLKSFLGEKKVLSIDYRSTNYSGRLRCRINTVYLR